MNLNYKFKIPQNSSTIHYRRKSSVSTKQKLASQDDCLFCTRKLKESYYPKMIVKALYSKFASSQNYYYTRDINDILANNRAHAVILHKDLAAYLEEDEEYLKRYYQINENPFKMKLLVEYYKFHRDIPRIFMVPTCDILNRYHDKRRRIEYIRIKKMLKEQEKQENKSIVSDTNIQDTIESNHESDKKNDPKNMIPVGNVLEGLELDLKEEIPKNVQLAKLLNQQKNNEISSSYSLLDLNKKLIDITEMKSELFEEANKNNFHDLSNFLNFMKNTKERKRNLDDLSEIERETCTSGFCYINLPLKETTGKQIIVKKESETSKPKSNKDLFAGAKRLDLSKLKKVEENQTETKRKEAESRPLSSARRNTPPTNVPLNKPLNTNLWQIQSKTVRDEIKTHRNFANDKIGTNSNNLNGLFKINSERVAYEKSKKNFVEIANEAANKIINKSQNILKNNNAQNTLASSKPTPNKSNHNRVNSLYCTTNNNTNNTARTQFKINVKESGSPNLKNPKAQITYNNFFKTKTSSIKESHEEYNNNNNNKNLQSKPNSLSKNRINQKISHKYTKSDPNLLFPKMIPTTINNNNRNSNNAISGKEENKGKKIEHSKKLSMNLDQMKKTPLNHGIQNIRPNANNNIQNPQYYTINQNNILNIYFGEEAKGIKIFFFYMFYLNIYLGANIKIKPKSKNIFFGNKIHKLN